MVEDNYPVILIRPNSRRTLSSSTINQKPKTSNKSRSRGRVVNKLGKAEVHRTARFLFFHYLRDLANTLINAPWKWTLLVLSFSFFLTWLFFAYLWMYISLDDDNSINPCLGGIQGFAGYLLFSIETQTSIGYGNRYINHHCPEAVLLLCVQIVVGICICGILISIVFEKISGPGPTSPRRAFSRYATICLRDRKHCLIFRVRDVEKKYQCNPKINAYLVQYRGEEIFLGSLKLQPIGFLLWPIEVCHIITENSPFWDLSAMDLVNKRLEIIVAIQGTSLSTSNTSSTTTSYLSREILWGHTFNPCVRYEKDRQSYVVDHKLFNSTKEVLMPLCSAQRLAQVFHDIPQYDLSANSNSSLFDCNKFRENYGEFQDFSPSIILHAMDENENSSSDDDQALFSSLNNKFGADVGEDCKKMAHNFTETSL